MMTAPVPPNEAERLTDLRVLKILDTPPEERFDRIARLAARIFDVPIAYIALVDADRQWFKAKCGLSVDETGRDVSFCGHTILQAGPLIVPDAALDPRFHDNPLVVGEPYLRFYAGYPLRGPGRHNVGTLCLVDRRPRSLDGGQLETFRQLAALAEHELRMVDLIQVQHELLETKNTLIETQDRLARELAEAAEYVRGLLPARLPGPCRTDWQFVTSSQLGGDLFGYHWLDGRHIAFYLFDVCGHGVGAALLSISVHTALRSETLPDTRFDRPGEVLASLNRAFPMEEHNHKFFTIWYGVYDTATRTLDYACAGHPPALVFDGAGQEPARLGASNLMIGILPDTSYDTRQQPIRPGNRLYLFSDGVFEVNRAGKDGEMLRVDGLIDLLVRASADGGSRVERVLRQIQALQGSPQFADDFSILEVEFE
jgi:sigma-B regulation protein RsbU (phosphoserine phosphatase)